VGASVGVRLWDGGGISVDELLVRADMALYAAKEAGRGRYALYAPQWANAAAAAWTWSMACARRWNAASWRCTGSPRWTSKLAHRRRRSAAALAAPQLGAVTRPSSSWWPSSAA
jgi:hypothetical protein